jgi:hypothetical protein
MSEREEPDLDRVREAMRNHDERLAEEGEEPSPPEGDEDAEDAEDTGEQD